MLEKIARLWPMANDLEITLEANPASADAARFADYRAAGVNRLSLGMQALNDADLKCLGRLHDARGSQGGAGAGDAEFRPGFAGSDLCPARTKRSAWRAELKEALSFGTDHLSLYQLTIEPEHAIRPALQRRRAENSGRGPGGGAL